MIKVLSVFGTRPEAIKMAPVLKELEKHSGSFVSRTCVTGQHRQMLDQVLQLFGIQPDYDLNVMQQSQSPTQVAAAVMAGLDPILRSEHPDWVLVQGDTTSVVAAAIAAFYARSRVGHVEAGLRTFDRYQPFPEEINRRIAGVVADLHFAPTEQSRRNLLAEGISDRDILVTGNTVIDALQQVAAMDYSVDTGPLAEIAQSKRRLVLVTAHRRESFGKPIEEICRALKDLALEFRGDIQIVYPVHLNPNIQTPVYHVLGDVSNITLLPPLDYLPLVHLLKQSYLILTDSGGLQEEAPGLGKPVLVLRNTTERPEAVEAGTVKLVGTSYEKIIAHARQLLTDSVAYKRMAQATNPYGDGHAAQRIVKALT